MTESAGRGKSAIVVKIPRVCFVIDGPVNALLASLIARESDEVHVIYALDNERRDLEGYLLTFKALLAEIKIASENIVWFDSARFWRGEKNDMLHAIYEDLDPLLKGHSAGTVYFGNCITNPVALALKRFARINHLYHAPGDFTNILFPRNVLATRLIKKAIKKILGIPLYEIEEGQYPLFSLVDIPSVSFNKSINFMNFSFLEVDRLLDSLIKEVKCEQNNILLLLSGDDPVHPNGQNNSNIKKYIKAHSNALDRFVRDNLINSARIWVKEHKSYLPLNLEERAALNQEFAAYGWRTKFMSDYLPKGYQSIPAECILKICKFEGVLGECSATLFHAAKVNIRAVAMASHFYEYRTKNVIDTVQEYLRLNKLVEKKFEVY